MENLIPVGLFILCLAGAVALLALAYFLYILVKIIRNTVNEKINPMLDDAADLIKQAKPIVGRVDPLMDRITLTIDGANLQIMRIDQIMEDVNKITGNVSKATSSVDKVTQAPLGIIAKATSVIREKISPVKNAEGTAGVVLTNVDNGLEIVGEKVADMQADNAQRAADREAAQEARDKAAEETNRTAANLKEAVFIKANADAGAN